MEAVFFQMLKERSTRAMQNAFRNARRPGRKQNIERMVKGQPLKLERLGLIGRQRRLKRLRFRNSLRHIIGLPCQGCDQNMG